MYERKTLDYRRLQDQFYSFKRRVGKKTLCEDSDSDDFSGWEETSVKTIL